MTDPDPHPIFTELAEELDVTPGADDQDADADGGETEDDPAVS